MAKSAVKTGKVRLSYVNLLQPKEDDNGNLFYQCCILIPKSDKKTVAKIKAEIERVYQDGKAKFGGKLPKVWKNPLRDGDEERDDQEEFEGHYFVNAKSKRKPGLVDSDFDAILDPEEVYSGMYARVGLDFYAFNWNGTSKGVGCGLNNVMKVADGEPLGGSAPSAEDDFGSDDEDDMMG